MTQEVEMALVNSKPLGHGVYVHPNDGSSKTTTSSSNSGSSSSSSSSNSSNSSSSDGGSNSLSSAFEQINQKHEAMRLQRQQQQQQHQQQQRPHQDLFKRHTLLHMFWQQQQQQQISPLQVQRLARATCAADTAAAAPPSAAAAAAAGDSVGQQDAVAAAAAILRQQQAAEQQQQPQQQQQQQGGVHVPQLHEALLPPRLPAIFRNNTGPVSVAGARVCCFPAASAASAASAVAAAVADCCSNNSSNSSNSSITNSSIPNSGISSSSSNNSSGSSSSSSSRCTDFCVAVELHQFVMKQRRCDYFNALNHLVSLLIDVSNLLALEPDRSLRPSLLYALCENLNSWLFCRRLFVAAHGGDFALTGVTIPLEQVGSDITQRRSSSSSRSSGKGGGSSSNSSSSNPSNNSSRSTSSTRLLHSSSSFPAAAAALPTLPAVQLLRIESKESRTLSSKKRAPYLLIIEVCDLDEDLEQFSDDPEVQREEVKTKPQFVLNCILKELKQRKMLPASYAPGDDPVTVVRRVLGMLETPHPAAAAAAGGGGGKPFAAAAAAAADAGSDIGELQHTKLEPPVDLNSPWRPSPSPPEAAAAGAAAAGGAAANAAVGSAAHAGKTGAATAEVVGGAALRLSENHFASRRGSGGSGQQQQQQQQHHHHHQHRTNALWGELWAARRERLRRKSPYGRLRSWDINLAAGAAAAVASPLVLHRILIKGGDDLRQELLASQLVRQFKAIFEEARLPLWLRPYEILVTGSNSGIMECIPDTCSVDVLKKKHNVDSIAVVFDTLFADNPFEAKKNFIESHAAYSLVSYLLQVKDRHNGNLLLDAEGHVIHIDYGFLLSNSPGNINFETAPFKLTQEFLDVMDGETSDNYEYFRTLIIRASKMPCFSGGPEYTLSALKERFMLGLAEDACIERVMELIDISVNNFRTVQYDNFQRITNGIL
ncbi:hypothetical protein ACSSS7_001357 [Eimeria intestinalis]